MLLLMLKNKIKKNKLQANFRMLQQIINKIKLVVVLIFLLFTFNYCH